MPRTTTMTAAALAAFAACTFAATAASQVVTSAGGEVVSSAQKHLVDNLIAMDSIQAATAKFAAGKTQNASVREFANAIAMDHAMHAAALTKLSAKKTVGRDTATENSSTKEFATRYAALQSAPAGAEFDRAFLQTVVANHQTEIAAINSGKTAATDEELKKDLEQTENGLHAHLTKANELTSTLEKSGMAPTKPPR